MHMAWFAPRRPAVVTQFRPGGDSRSASFPVDDIHQAWIAEDLGGWGMTFGEDKTRDRPRKSATALSTDTCALAFAMMQFYCGATGRTGKGSFSAVQGINGECNALSIALTLLLFVWQFKNKEIDVIPSPPPPSRSVQARPAAWAGAGG